MDAFLLCVGVDVAPAAGPFSIKRFPGSELQVAYFGTVESATEWLTGFLIVVNEELDID